MNLKAKGKTRSKSPAKARTGGGRKEGRRGEFNQRRKGKEEEVEGGRVILTKVGGQRGIANLNDNDDHRLTAGIVVGQCERVPVWCATVRSRGARGPGRRR